MSEKQCTRLCDSNGNVLYSGDKIKRPTNCNQEVHGDWTVCEIVLQGSVPVLSYLYSEKGKILPEGTTRSFLSDEYDQKLLLWATDISKLRPTNTLVRLSD